MPSLNSDNNLQVQITTTADNSGIDDTNKGLQSVGKTTSDTGKTTSAFAENFNSNMKKVALGVGALGVGITAYAKNATDYTVSLLKSSKDLSRETGTTVENASQLVYVAGKMGISADQASTVFGAFSKKIVAATDDIQKSAQAHADLQNKIDKTKLDIQLTTAEIQKHGDKTGELTLKVRTLNTDLAGQQTALTAASNAFEKLGIKVVDSSGHTRSFNELLLDTADKFKGMQAGSEKTALAMELFGRSGKDLLPLLNQGSQGILNLEQQADKLGLTLDATNIGSIQRYIKSQKELKDTTDSLKLAVGEATAPVLTAFNNKINEILLNLLATDSPMRGFTANVLAFGGPALSFISAGIAVAANLVTITTGASAAGAAIGGLELTAAAGVVLPVAGALAALAALAGAIYEVDKAFEKVNKGIDDLAAKKVKLNNSNISVGGTSSTGLIQQLRNAFSGFASGTDFAPGGVSLVGEEGPELVNLPRGSQVTPAPETKKILGKRGGDVNITQHIYNQVDYSKGIAEIGFRLSGA